MVCIHLATLKRFDIHEDGRGRIDPVEFRRDLNRRLRNFPRFPSIALVGGIAVGPIKGLPESGLRLQFQYIDEPHRIGDPGKEIEPVCSLFLSLSRN